MSDPIIQVRDLRKIYHVGDVDVPALRGISLDVGRGEFLSVVGPSGSGKSTLFHILGGLASPSTGKVIIDGEDMSTLTENERTRLRRTRVGFVFQKYNLLPTLSALDNIRMAQHFGGNAAAKGSELSPQFKDLLKSLGIHHRMHHKPRALSGGEQQRVAIARALVNQPAILLADEPTGNLDTENSDIVLRLLRDLNDRFGQTILMITHNPEAASYGHRIVHMRDGRLAD